MVIPNQVRDGGNPPQLLPARILNATLKRIVCNYSYQRRASRSRGSSGTSVKLWEPPTEDALKILVKHFGTCL